MKKQGLHIVDGKITTEDGKELILIFRDCAERFEERLKEHKGARGVRNIPGTVPGLFVYICIPGNR